MRCVRVYVSEGGVDGLQLIIHFFLYLEIIVLYFLHFLYLLYLLYLLYIYRKWREELVIIVHINVLRLTIANVPEKGEKVARPGDIGEEGVIVF